MKIKSFTLVEILVASAIFMSVVVIAVSSTAMVTRSGARSDDLRRTMQCARQTEDYIVQMVRSSGWGERLFALRNTGGRLLLAAPETGGENYPGLVVFPGEGRFLAIFKEGGQYLSRRGSVGDDMSDGQTLPLSDGPDEPLHPASCAALEGVAIGGGDFLDHLDEPFLISTSKGGVQPVYVVVLEDAFYRAGQETRESALEKNLFAKIYLKVTNARGLF